MHARHAGLVSGEEARQLVGGKDEVDSSNDEQDNADQGQHELHGGFLLDKWKGVQLARTASQPVYRHPAAPRKWRGRLPSFRHPELKRICRDALFLEAGGRAVSAAKRAVQLEADGARAVALLGRIRPEVLAADGIVENL